MPDNVQSSTLCRREAKNEKKAKTGRQKESEKEAGEANSK
jgi:hypothetical protein